MGNLGINRLSSDDDLVSEGEGQSFGVTIRYLYLGQDFPFHGPVIIYNSIRDFRCENDSKDIFQIISINGYLHMNAANTRLNHHLWQQMGFRDCISAKEVSLFWSSHGLYSCRSKTCGIKKYDMTGSTDSNFPSLVQF